MVRVTCPHCGQHINTAKDPDEVFEVQGRVRGKPIIKCRSCGKGMLPRLFGRAQPIPAEAWAQHQQVMWDEFDSPEARERRAAELEERLRRLDEE